MRTYMIINVDTSGIIYVDVYMIKFTHICCVCVSTIFTETEVYTLWHHVAMRPGFRLSRPGFRLNRPNMAQRPNVYASRPSEGQLVN